MSKNILVIHTQNNIKPLFDLFEEIKIKGHEISFLSTDTKLLSFCQEKKIECKKISFWPPLTGATKLKINLFLGKYYFSAFIILLSTRFNKKINTIVCVNWIEKLLFTPIANLLKMKIIWLETKLVEYSRLSINQKWLIKKLSKSAQVIAFTNFAKEELFKFGMKKDRIKVLPLGIKFSQHQHQDNLFSKLAQGDRFSKRKKFFTIGTIVNLNQKNIEKKIETLLRSINLCLRLIPDLQLIIIGDGQERKNLMWLAKKMEIDSYIWFVGEQLILKKWLDNFDIYIVNCPSLNLEDIYNVLMAQAAQLPIIGPNNIGLDTFVQSEKNGLLIEADHNDELAQSIMRLYKDKRLRNTLGKQAKEFNQLNFSIDRMVQGFQKIIE
ncbi:glycosyltransferase family 4 protein [Patescibacteria group bacterium]